MSKWVNIIDRLPESEEEILILDNSLIEYYGYLPVVGYYDLSDCEFYTSDDRKLSNITHWAFLPEPPKT